MDIESILLQAVELSSDEERRAFIDRACLGDPVVRQEVDRLVTNHFRAEGFLESPPAELIADAVRGDRHQTIGTTIGPYVLREEIGEGGMGVVYVAEQQFPLRRLVALKIIKPGMDSRAVIARFNVERQALALMNHENIARVLDAGNTATGTPYFVMELIRGVPITEHCNQRALDIRSRLELFARVCGAIQHAHQKGIIHRDIKPTNVLVTLYDDVPMPKVIDFGVAKAINQSLTERTIYTGLTQMIGTPQYMSPEQAEMNALDVDTRSDVYSLGVLLYELLVGSPPFSGDSLRQLGFDEMRRVIREQPPLRPSQRMNTLDAHAGSTVSTRRGIDPRQLRQVLRTELDWIVMKALEKNRNRRYESAGALATDIQRYLHHEPVEACPPSNAYRLQKFVRKHRATVIPLSLIAVSLVSATVISLAQTRIARTARQFADERLRQEERAKRAAEQDRQRAVVNYQLARQAIADMVRKLTDTNVPKAETWETNDAVRQQAFAFYGELIRRNPENHEAYFDRGELLQRMNPNDAYVAFPDFAQAVQLEPQNALYRQQLALAHPSRRAGLTHIQRALALAPRDLDIQMDYVRILCDLSEFAHAREELCCFAAAAPHTAEAAKKLAVEYLRCGSLDLALAAAREALALDATNLANYETLAQVLIALSQWDEALACMNDATRRFAAPHLPHEPGVFWLRGDLLVRRGMYAAAIEDYNRAIEFDPSFWIVYKRRAEAYFHLGKYKEALADVRWAMELHPSDASSICWIGTPLIAQCSDESYRRGIVSLLDKVIAEPPPRRDSRDRVPLAHFYRALLMAEAGRIEDAFLDVAQVVKSPAQAHDWCRGLFVVLALATDQPQVYRDACRELAASGFDDLTREDVHTAVTLCMLEPNVLENYEPLILRLRRDADCHRDEHAAKARLGVMLCRGGHLDEAVNMLTQEAHGSDYFAVLSRYFLAVAEFRRSHVDQTRIHLEDATRARNELMMQPFRRGEQTQNWHYRLTLKRLQEEVTQLLSK